MIYLLITITFVFMPNLQVDGKPELNFDHHIVKYSEYCNGTYIEKTIPHNPAPDGKIYAVHTTDANIICWMSKSADKAGNESDWSEESQYKNLNVQIGKP